jgi:hypothetical protein
MNDPRQTIAHDAHSGTQACPSISEQIAAIERELASEVAGVIDLSNGQACPKPRTPVLRAIASENGRTLLAWCPYCRREHTHGRHGDCAPGTCDCGQHADLHGFRGPCTCPAGAGDGHRGAHCWPPTSPFRATGYILVEVTP